MNSWRGILMAVALMALFAGSARAMTHEEHCAHETSMEEEAPAEHNHHDAAAHGDHSHASHAVAEEVPHTTPKDSGCPHHPGQACQCKSHLMIGCNMQGCCLKADGPLSTGLKDRTPHENDNALCDSPALPDTDGRLVNTALGGTISPRDLPGPDPRPPSL